MATRKNNFLNAKPVSKMGGGSGGVRKPSKPYQKPSSTSGKPKLQSKPQKPAAKPSRPAVNLPNSRRAGVNLPKVGASVERSTTQGPSLRGTTPSARSGAPKPSAKPAATKPNPFISGKPNPKAAATGVIGKPKPPVSGVRRVGGGLVSGTILTAAAGKAIETLGRAAQPSEWDRVQRELQARGYGGRKPVNKDPNGRSSRGVNTPQGRTVATGSQQYNDYRNQQIAAERERLKGVGNAPKPVARPSASRPSQSTPSRSTASGSGSQRSAAPQATKPAMPGRKFEDFNPGRGTSKSNNPLLDSESGGMKLRDRMKQREASQQSEAASKLSNKFGQDSGYLPQTKVDGSKYADKKPDMKKVNEYDRRKRRYYD